MNCKTKKLIIRIPQKLFELLIFYEKGEHIVKTSPDIDEAFNSHFATIGEKLASEIPAESKLHPLAYVEPIDSSFTIHKITSKEVHALLSNIDTKKAAGLDKILLTLFRLGGGGGAFIPAPTLIGSQFQTI